MTKHPTMTQHNQAISDSLINSSPEPSPPAAHRGSFRWLLGGAFISMLGDQFTLIGLPWLTLKVSGDPLALGIVLAVIGIPRAIFILFGGAIADKYSPKSVLILSKYINTVLLGLLAYTVLTGAISMPILYALSATIGFASALGIPAGTSMLPFVIPRPGLAKANGLLMGMRQVTLFLGPLIAGLVIAGFGSAQIGGHETVEDTAGLALVFALDGLSFLISALTLTRVRLLDTSPKAPHSGTRLRTHNQKMIVAAMQIADMKV